MITYILNGLGVIFLILLLAASMKPDTVRYERSSTIQAPPARILPHLTDFHAWRAWSPWEKLDPDMKRDYAGPGEGKGARYAWSGDNKAGEGTMEILDVTPTSVKIDLRFVRPFKNTCNVLFDLVPQGDATQVIWRMDGPNLFMGKLMSLVMDMDKMIGKDFERGLADLKSVSEK